MAADTLSADERIAQVQANAAEHQSGINDPETSEQVATTSHYSSMAVGAGIAAKGGWVGLAAFAAGVAGGMAGAWVSEALGAPELVAKGLEAFGMRRVGAGGPHPGTIGKKVAHSMAFAGFLASIVVGAIAAVAVGALIVATGGLAAVAVIGAAAAGGFAGGLIGSALGGAMASMGTPTGAIATGSPDVFIESMPAARVTDIAPCSKEYGAPSPIIEGSETIFVNGLPLARIGHKLLCGAVVDEGAMSVFTDSTTTAIAVPAPDIPLWARVAADWVGFLPMGKLAAFMGKRSTSSVAKGKAGCNTKCATDPVDVATGAFVDWRTDIAIPSVLPLALSRRYNSQASMQPSLFGPRWRDSWSVQLRRPGADANTIDYQDEEGVVLTFDTPFELLEAAHLRMPNLMLRGSRSAPVLHDSETGTQHHFEWTPTHCARLAAYSDANGNRCNFTYRQDDGRLQSVQHSDGWQLLLQWAASTADGVYPQQDRLVGIWLHEPDRTPVELVRYAQDAKGRLTHCASLTSGQMRYAYDDQHRIVAWGDASHTRTHLHYDDAGRVHEVRTTGGEVHSGRLVYHPKHRVTEVWAIEPDAQGTPQLGGKREYHYNDDGLVTHERDALGRITATEWDRHHRVTAQVDALGRRTTYRYDARGLIKATHFADGRSAMFVHDELARLSLVTDAAGRSRSFDYGATGLVVARTEGVLRWQYTHDARGHVMEERGPDGALHRHHWDAHHRPCGHTAPNGGHTAWQQSRLGQLDWLTDATGATTTYAYEASPSPCAGGHTQPTRVTRADGSTEHFQLDAEGLLQSYTDAAGHTQRWQWGAFDLLASHTDALGKTTAYRWGNEGRLDELINAAGQRWRWFYDTAGQCVQQIDYAGRVTRWQNDAAGRTQLRTAPDGVTLIYTWDAADRLAAIHARGADGAEQLHLSYHHDQRDNLLCARVWHLSHQASQLQSELRMAYDDAGNLCEEQHTDETGRTRRITWRHDAAGRVIARNAALGETAYALDALGLLAQWHSEHGDLHLQRDALGREIERQGFAPRPPGTSAAQPVPGTGTVPAGLPAAPGFILQHRHDKLGHLVLQQQLPGAPGTAHGQLRVHRQYHWQSDRLVGVDDARFGRVRWQLDARDQIRQAKFEPTLFSPGEHANPLRDLPASAMAAPPSAVRRNPLLQQFEYDANGNLARQDGVPLRYDGDTVVEHGAMRYRWDACGRLIGRTEHRAGWRPRTWHYQWDALDRLVGVHTPEGQRWRYLYDAFGRRRGKRCDTPATGHSFIGASNKTAPSIGGGSVRSDGQRPLLRTDYLWDGPTVAAQWKLYADGRNNQMKAADAMSGSDDVQEWHYEPDTYRPLTLVTRFAGQEARLLHVVADLNGAPREAFDNQGCLVWAGQLDTWGRMHFARIHNRVASPLQDRSTGDAGHGWRDAANDPQVDIDLRHTNQWADEESGLLYNLNRHYDADLGQYATLDPLGPIDGGLRTHGYVHNPVTWVDPLGLTPCPILIGKYKNLRAKGLTSSEAYRVAKGGKYTANSHAHLASSSHLPNSSPTAGKGRFLQGEGGQHFTDEVVYHPNTTITRQSNGRLRFDNSNLGRGQVGIGADLVSPVKGGRVVLESTPPSSYSAHSATDVVTQFPQ